MPEENGLLRGTVLLTFSGLFGQVVGFLYRVALSRLLGAELMGVYQLIMPVYSVLSALTTVGLTMAMSTLAAGFWGSGDREGLFRLRRQCFRLLLTAFLPLAVVTLLASDFISVSLLGDARTRLGLLLLLPCLLLTAVENLQKYAFFATDHMLPPALSEMAEQLIRAAAVLGLLVTFLPQNGEKTVALVALGMSFCEVCSAITLTLMFRIFFGKTPKTAKKPKKSNKSFQSNELNKSNQELDRRLRRDILRVALPVSATAVAGNVMGSVNAVLIPKRLVHSGLSVSDAMSAFGVVNGMTLPMLLMPSAFIGAMGLVLVPKLARNVALGQGEAVRCQVGRSIAATAVLLLPAMGLLCVLGPTLGERLFQNTSVGNHMVPLVLGVTLTCFQSILGSALNGIGKQSAAAGNMLLSDGVQLVFTYVFVGMPEVGLEGYAWGLCASSLLGAALNWVDLRRATGLRAQIFTWLVAPTLGTVLMVLCGRLLYGRLVELGLSPLAGCAVTALFGAVLYLSALQAQGLRWGQFFGRRGSELCQSCQ